MEKKRILLFKRMLEDTGFDDPEVAELLWTGVKLIADIPVLPFWSCDPTKRAKITPEMLWTSAKEAQAAGIAHARDASPTKYKGRKPSFTAEQLLEIGQLSQQGVGINEIARQVGLSKFAVSRILKDVEAAQIKLRRWE